MKKTTLLSLALTLVLASISYAAPTDIVSTGSTLNDAFMQLVRGNYLGPNLSPSDFLGDTLHTRGQLAHLLETTVLVDPSLVTNVAKDKQSAAALRAAVIELQPELKADAVDVDTILDSLPANSFSAGALVQPEARIESGGANGPKSGEFGIYRATVLGDLSKQFRYVVSASNWEEDQLRPFQNDIGSHGLSGINEAYIELHNSRGLTFDVGRQNNRWGAGYNAATLISDNAGPFDQLQLAFPFSLGRHLGRNYRFDQIVTTYKELGVSKYLEARRIEYAFNNQWNFQFEEAFKSTAAGSLLGTFFPYEIQGADFSKIPGLHATNLDNQYNYVVNFGLSYQPSTDIRFYGQTLIDDLKKPFSNSTKYVPQKLAFVVGGTGETSGGTGLTLEYDYADPTTYSQYVPALQWQRGTFEEIGLPSGPNTREIYGRLSQRIGTDLTLAVTGRDRRRVDNSFPAPQSRDIAGEATYKLNQTNDVTLSYHDYSQDPYPYTPGAPNYPPGNGYQPQSEGNPGQYLRIKETDVSYHFFF